ncbi:hypothetical protein EXM65_13085 [Clostridium botulinum]|uniref:DUF2187 domain-containing protein n=1 Tax=Clostridium botulinum TaxID=1491 RepID=A0A6M0SSX8_CLOBO|nr:hypothetical protein [Clostridium botulinum]
MNKGINLSLFDMFDLDNNEQKVNNNSVNVENTLNNNENEELQVSSEVYVEYDGEHYIGVVHRIYNDWNTVNVIFENKHSAFHISKVKKL